MGLGARKARSLVRRCFTSEMYCGVSKRAQERYFSRVEVG